MRRQTDFLKSQTDLAQKAATDRRGRRAVLRCGHGPPARPAARRQLWPVRGRRLWAECSRCSIPTVTSGRWSPGSVGTSRATSCMTGYLKDRGSPALRNSKLYCPEGSDWLLPLPRQWDPLFHTDPRLADHVITRSLWTFTPSSRSQRVQSSPGRVTARRTPPAGGSTSRNPDRDRLAQHHGLRRPLDRRGPGRQRARRARHDRLHRGHARGRPGYNSGANLFLPMLQWGFFPPPPDDVLVFGWSHFAFVLARGTLQVLRATDASRTAWERLGPPGSPSRLRADPLPAPAGEPAYNSVIGALPAATFPAATP